MPLSSEVLSVQKDIDEARTNLEKIFTDLEKGPEKLIAYFGSKPTLACDPPPVEAFNKGATVPATHTFVNLFNETLMALKWERQEKFLESYRKTAEPKAKKLLEFAKKTHSLKKLDEVALRYPLTESARDALLWRIHLYTDRAQVLPAVVHAMHLARFYTDILSPKGLEFLHGIFSGLNKPVPKSLFEASFGETAPHSLFGPSLQFVENQLEKTKQAVPSDLQLIWKGRVADFLEKDVRRETPHHLVRTVGPLFPIYDLAFSTRLDEREAFKRLVRFGPSEFSESFGCSIADPFAVMTQEGAEVDRWLGIMSNQGDNRRVASATYLLQNASSQGAVQILKRFVTDVPAKSITMGLAKMKQDGMSDPPYIFYHLLNSFPLREMVWQGQDLFEAVKDSPEVMGVTSLLADVRPFAFRMDDQILERLKKPDPKEVVDTLHLMAGFFPMSPALEKAARDLMAHADLEVRTWAMLYLIATYQVIDDKMRSQIAESLKNADLQLEVLQVLERLCEDKQLDLDPFLFLPSVRDFSVEQRDTAGSVIGCILKYAPNESFQTEFSKFARDATFLHKDSVLRVYLGLPPTPSRVLDLNAILDMEADEQAVVRELLVIQRWQATYPAMDYSSLLPSLRRILAFKKMSVSAQAGGLLSKMGKLSAVDLEFFFIALEKFPEETMDQQDRASLFTLLLQAAPQEKRGIVEKGLAKAFNENDVYWSIGMVLEQQDFSPYLEGINRLFLKHPEHVINPWAEGVRKSAQVRLLPQLGTSIIQMAEKNTAVNLRLAPDGQQLAVPKELLPSYRSLSSQLLVAIKAARKKTETWEYAKVAREERLIRIAVQLPAFEEKDLDDWLNLSNEKSYNRHLRSLIKSLLLKMPEADIDVLASELVQLIDDEGFSPFKAHSELDLIAARFTEAAVERLGVEDTEALTLQLKTDTESGKVFKMLALIRLPVLSKAANDFLLGLNDRSQLVVAAIKLEKAVTEGYSDVLNERVEDLLRFLGGAEDLQMGYHEFWISMQNTLKKATIAKPSLASILVDHLDESKQAKSVVLNVLHGASVKKQHPFFEYEMDMSVVRTLAPKERRRLAKRLVELAITDDGYKMLALILARDFDSDYVRQVPEPLPGNVKEWIRQKADFGRFFNGKTR